MPRRRKLAHPRPTPIQLPLFAETASLVRIRPALHEWRYYRMEVWPDLFGRALLVRQWGRIGTEGHRRLDPHPDPGAAINALADILRAKRRRGYQDRTCEDARPAAGTCHKRCGQGRRGETHPSRNADHASSRRFQRGARKRRTETPSPAPQTGMQLHTADGTRKYLTAGERDAFLREADLADRPVRTLCMTLAYAGCRLSEALALTADRVDLAAGVLVFESLKKRRSGIFRSVLVPLPCSIQSMWCMASASCTPGAAKAVACDSGRGRG